jgi:hypothetical protein
MPSPTIDRIARKSVPIQVPQFPSKSAIASAAQRKDLVAIGAAEDFQNEEWRKKLQLALETAIASALLSLSTTSAGTGATGEIGAQGERGATGERGPQGVAGESGTYIFDGGTASTSYSGALFNLGGAS